MKYYKDAQKNQREEIVNGQNQCDMKIHGHYIYIYIYIYI